MAYRPSGEARVRHLLVEEKAASPAHTNVKRETLSADGYQDFAGPTQLCEVVREEIMANRNKNEDTDFVVVGQEPRLSARVCRSAVPGAVGRDPRGPADMRQPPEISLSGYYSSTAFGRCGRDNLSG
jgi:hypothetical protein